MFRVSKSLLGKLVAVKGNVRSTLDKLKGIKSDLVCGHEGWQEWTFQDLLKKLKKWRDINPIEENSDKNISKDHGVQSPRSKFFHTPDSHHETRVRACVYCEDNSHKSANCSEVITKEDRKKIFAKKTLCFNCTGLQHRAADCKSKMGCQKCHKRHHTSICNNPPSGTNFKTAQVENNGTVTYPVVIVDVEGIKWRALLDTGAGSSYASEALLDRIPKRQSKKETRKIEMMLGMTTREVELSTIENKGTSSKFSMSVEVTKVNKGELVFIDNPKYQQLITGNPHLKGVVMEDQCMHVILGASEYAKLKTDTAPTQNW